MVYTTEKLFTHSKIVKTAHVDYARYLLKMLALLKFVLVSNGIHTNAYSFFLKKGKRVLK